MVTSSQVIKFLLLGFSSFSELQPVLFVLFLCLYLIIPCSNLTIFSIICQPLRYLILMTWRVCGQLATTCIVSGFLISLVGTILVFSLPFCGSNKVKHYFCDISPVIQLACAETYVNELVIFICGILALVVPLIFNCMSYGFIVHTILKIPSDEGRCKAFYTCAFHLIVFIVHYGCASSVYVQFSAKYSSSKDRL